MKKIPIALQLYSVRDFLEKDFEGTLQVIKNMGYEGVEFAGSFNMSWSDIKNICDKVGVTPVSAHVPYDEMVEESESVFEFYRAIGCEYIVIPFLTEEYRPNGEQEEKFYYHASKLARDIQKYNMKLLYHNHDFEFEKINGEYALDIMYYKIPMLETEIDTCWVNVAGENPADYILKYSNRAPVVHLKDFVGGKTDSMYALIGIDDSNDMNSKNREFEFRPLGQGVQNIPAILEAAEKAGSSWIVVEQDATCCGKTSLECAMESIKYLRGILK